MVVAEQRFIIGRIAIVSSPARRDDQGRLTIASTSMIPTWGWLMIGVPPMAPKPPGFVIVNVPPCTSSGTELLRAGALGEILDRPRDAEQVLLLGVADHGDDEALAVVEGDGDAEVDGAA